MKKLIIYQALARLWKNGRFSDWDESSLGYLKSLHVDCLWLTGVPEHAVGQDFVKGDPGSPYAISDWYDVNAYLADNKQKRMCEFESLIKRVHSAGIKLLTDFIPNHVARNYKRPLALCQWCDYDWTDTLKVDYGNASTEAEMTRIVRFWASKGIDGMRCDMVELVPLPFFSSMIREIKSDYPDFIFIGEVYDKANYRPYLDAGFDLLYDKSGLYDTLVALKEGNSTARAITWNWQSLGDMQPRMLNFLENHDEKRAAAPDMASLAVSALFNDASFMFYFGQEYGEAAAESSDGRTSIFNWVRKLDPVSLSDSSSTERFRDILSLAASEPFRSGRNWDLCYAQTDPSFDPDRHFAFLRFDDSNRTLVVCNFGSEDVEMEIDVPSEAIDGISPVRVDVAAHDCVIVSF